MIVKQVFCRYFYLFHDVVKAFFMVSMLAFVSLQTFWILEPVVVEVSAKLSDLTGDDGESAFCFSCFCGFDGDVQRQQVGLGGDGVFCHCFWPNKGLAAVFIGRLRGVFHILRILWHGVAVFVSDCCVMDDLFRLGVDAILQLIFSARL